MVQETTAKRPALVLGFPEYGDAGRRLANAAGLPYEEIELHRFPDGESLVRLPESLPERIIVCRSLHQPNAKLIELGLVSSSAWDLGARHLTLVAPYMAYMRQDKAFRPGEAVSQRIIGSLLARWFDKVVTVDPHLHRTEEITLAVPAITSKALTAGRLIGEYLEGECENPLLVGPDEESAQWVAAVAEERGWDYAVGEKRRNGDTEVKITLPERHYAGRHLVLVDDIVSTGHTLQAAAGLLASHGPASLSAMVIHPLFLEGALNRLERAGIRQIWSTDSIPHPTNVICLADLLTEAL